MTPFLPGDSLLFAVGALAAVDQTGTLKSRCIWLLLMVAAVLGNEVNFRIGRAIGPRAFSGGHSLAEAGIPDCARSAFYEKHGGKTIILSRFMPIIRTFAPFVAGVGTMQRRRFAAYNFVGGFAWVTMFIWGGYLFGNVPIIKEQLRRRDDRHRRRVGAAGRVGPAAPARASSAEIRRLLAPCESTVFRRTSASCSRHIAKRR